MTLSLQKNIKGILFTSMLSLFGMPSIAAQLPSFTATTVTLPDGTKQIGPALLTPSIYHIADADRYACDDQDKVQIKNQKGVVITKVCPAFRKKLDLEGTGVAPHLTDPNETVLLNVAGAGKYVQVDQTVCPYGLGVKNLCLVPYISIAADKTQYKPGDVVYIPMVANAGIILPNGELHAGYFVVTDVGSAIKGIGRFDFFTGEMEPFEDGNMFRDIAIAGPCKPNKNKTCADYFYYRVEGPEADDARAQADRILDYYRSLHKKVEEN